MPLKKLVHPVLSSCCLCRQQASIRHSQVAIAGADRVYYTCHTPSCYCIFPLYIFAPCMAPVRAQAVPRLPKAMPFPTPIFLFIFLTLAHFTAAQPLQQVIIPGPNPFLVTPPPIPAAAPPIEAPALPLGPPSPSLVAPPVGAAPPLPAPPPLGVTQPPALEVPPAAVPPSTVPLPVVPSVVPSVEAVDPCACTSDGLSAGVNTSFIGCGQWLVPEGNNPFVCFVNVRNKPFKLNL